MIKGLTRSDQINELATALSKMQAEMSVARRDSKNPFFKSKYADLAAVWDAVQKPLTNAGLSVTQILGRDNGNLTVTTMLMHSSGQFLMGELSAKVPQLDKDGVSYEDPQKIGSLITYLRRYSLAAICGLAVEGEDDDAEGALGRGASRPTGKGQKVDPGGSQDSTGGNREPRTEPQRKKLWVLIKGASDQFGWNETQQDDFQSWLMEKTECMLVDDKKTFTKFGASKAIDKFMAFVEEWVNSHNPPEDDDIPH